MCGEEKDSIRFYILVAEMPKNDAKRVRMCNSNEKEEIKLPSS